MKLLDVCELDSRALQLRHRRAHLPQASVVAELQASKKTTDDAVRDARVTRDDLERVQKKADADVEAVKTRRRRDQERMDSGAISSAKDLERMQHEMVSLQRRIVSLEDDELEIMGRLEDLQRDLDEVTVRLTAADERLAELRAASAGKTDEIDSALGQIVRERETTAEGLPEDLVALYEKLRAHKGGVAAAALHQRRCTGCQLGIDNAELAVIARAPADLVIRCEECSRILVRTAESGL